MSVVDLSARASMLRSLRAVGPTAGANLINQAVVVLSQLIIIPVLIGKWGLEGYGSWLLLTAIPTYLAISDLGFTTSAKSDMSMRVARGDVSGAQVTASSVAALLLVALGVVGALYFSLVYGIDWASLLNLSAIPTGAAQAVLGLGFVQLASYQAFLLSAGVIRAAGHPATEVLLSAGFRALETMALLTAALLGGDIVLAATAWALARLATSVAVWGIVAARLPQLVPRASMFSKDRVKTLLAPSLSYTLLPLANAASLQGTVLVIGAVAGPVTVAVFSAMRIVTRLGVSAANTLNYAFTPQYSFAIGRGDGMQVGALLRLHRVLLLAGIAAYLGFMTLLGPWLVGLVSRGLVATNPAVLAILSLAATFEILWSLKLAFKTADNSVGRIALAWLAASLCSVVLVALLPGLVGAALAAMLAHAAMVVFAFTARKTGSS